MLKKNITRAVFASLLTLFSTAALAELKIGFVNTQKIMEAAPQVASANQSLKEEFAPRESALVAEQKKLKEQEERFKRDSAVMSEDNRRKMERDIVARQRELKRARDEFLEDLNIRRNEVFAKLQQVVGSSILNLAKEEGYDLILENGVVFASERVDITDKVIERLKSSTGQ